MNVTKKVRQQNAGRFVILFIAACIAGFALGGTAGVVWAAALFIAAPSLIALAAFNWTLSAEWTRLGAAEDYGTAAQRTMEAANQQSLRETLDPIGQEALDELEAALARREEDRKGEAE